MNESADHAVADPGVFDLFDLPPGYFDAPWLWHKFLRDHDPVHRNADGTVLLTRYADVLAVWRDPGALVDKAPAFERKFGAGALLEHHTTSMLFRDPPAHDRLRAVVQPFLGRDRVASLTDHIRQIAERALLNLEQRREFDFVNDFALGIPIQVICSLLGVPGDDAPWLHEQGVNVLFPLNPLVDTAAIARGHAATEQLKTYFHEHLARVMSTRRGSTVSCLLAALGDAIDAGLMSETEALHMCILLMNGGHETTTNLLAISLHSFLDQPDQARDWLAHPEISGTAVEELVRFVSPLQLQGRRLVRDVDLTSGHLPAGTEVVVCQASANRDERKFADPDRLDLRRKPNVHLSFGMGLHHCVGQFLARLEATIVLPMVLAHFARLERTAPARFMRNARFRGLESLPLRFSPSA